MAEGLIHTAPELESLLLSGVHFSGTTIGKGAYSSVEAVTVPVEAVAKTISQGQPNRLLKECQLMSTLCNPHIVQFIGVFSDSGSPALVMEQMLTSLHTLLQSVPSESLTAFFTMELKCSVLHDVASGLAYLHEQEKPIIHRNLTAKNLLLNSKMIAKITDLGVARNVEADGSKATVAPESVHYMPPEALERPTFKYQPSIDIFSLGIVTIFTLGEEFPCFPRSATYTDETSGLLKARSELERRSDYMHGVASKLEACGVDDNILIDLITKCLQNIPTKRPGIRDVLCQLEKARAGAKDVNRERNKLELVKVVKGQPINQVRK